MRIAPLAAVLVGALLAPAASPSSISLPEFHARRDKLRKNLHGALILLGAPVEPDNNLIPWHQETNFLYLTGWREPGARLILTPDAEFLFLPHHNEHLEHYTGARLSAEDPNAAARAGFDTVLPVEKFEQQLALALASGPDVYIELNSSGAALLKPFLALRHLTDASSVIAPIRRVKSDAEIAAIQHSTDVSIAAHLAAWRQLTPGAYEYQAQAAFTQLLLERGCEGYAYPPIIGSGLNGAILHYDANHRRMDRGDAVVIDAAAQCDGYASDITRTLPVSGKFTPRQLEIYNIVLAAQQAGIASIKPKANLRDVDKAARDYIASHGADLHGKPLDKYFTHGIGHDVGLDVHDPPATPDQILEPGMVVTVEPGIYLPEESFGVRIEDVVLVTATGARVLSAALPKDPSQVEAILAHP